jgi:hopanoid biosynthesis associated protein HpnK
LLFPNAYGDASSSKIRAFLTRCYTLHVRRLIVNADDFGLTSGVNRAIVEAHCQGVVTSTTLMANAAAFDEAVRISRSAPNLSSGCHVVLVDGRAVLRRSQIPSLLKSNPGSDEFHDRLGSFALRALIGSFDSAELESEITAQIRKLQSAGIAVSHLDTHKHTHMFRPVLMALLRASAACGIRALRNPFEPVGWRELVRRRGSWKRPVQIRALRVLAPNFVQKVRSAGMVTPDGTVGITVTGDLDESLFRSLAEGLPEGTWELVCHPGYNDAELQTVRTRLRASRAQELKLLTSPESRQILEKNSIQLMSYRELTA